MRRLLWTLGAAAVVSGCSYPPDVTINAPPEILPPMGWNSWNSGVEFDDQSIRETIDTLVRSGMRDAGYTDIILDAGWAAPQRNSIGQLVADPQRFPLGLKPLVDYAHEQRLRFGLYSSPFNQTCGQGVGTASLGHEVEDAATFAAWGVDYLKYDWCNTSADHGEQVEIFAAMGSALRASGRRIVYSINPNSSSDPTAGARFDWSGVADVVRTSGDLVPLWRNGIWPPDGAGPFAEGAFNGVSEQFADAAAATTQPAYRNDADMLVVGVTWSEFFLNHRQLLLHSLETHPLTANQRALIERIVAMPTKTVRQLATAQPNLTEDEQRSHFSLWAMLGSPLVAGNDLRSMSPTTLSILSNREVIAIDQDPLMAKPHPIDRHRRIWTKALVDSSVAVALFNPSSEPADMATTTAAIGLPAASCYTLHDLWSGRITTTPGDIRTTAVAAHAVVLFTVRTSETCSP